LTKVQGKSIYKFFFRPKKALNALNNLENNNQGKNYNDAALN